MELVGTIAAPSSGRLAMTAPLKVAEGHPGAMTCGVLTLPPRCRMHSRRVQSCARAHVNLLVCFLFRTRGRPSRCPLRWTPVGWRPSWFWSSSVAPVGWRPSWLWPTSVDSLRLAAILVLVGSHIFHDLDRPTGEPFRVTNVY